MRHAHRGGRGVAAFLFGANPAGRRQDLLQRNGSLYNVSSRVSSAVFADPSFPIRVWRRGRFFAVRGECLPLSRSYFSAACGARSKAPIACKLKRSNPAKRIPPSGGIRPSQKRPLSITSAARKARRRSGAQGACLKPLNPKTLQSCKANPAAVRRDSPQVETPALHHLRGA